MRDRLSHRQRRMLAIALVSSGASGGRSSPIRTPGRDVFPPNRTAVLLSGDSEQIDQDAAIVEALSEQYAAPDRNGPAAPHDEDTTSPRTKRNRLRTRKSPRTKTNHLPPEDE